MENFVALPFGKSNVCVENEKNGFSREIVFTVNLNFPLVISLEDVNFKRFYALDFVTGDKVNQDFRWK